MLLEFCLTYLLIVVAGRVCAPRISLASGWACLRARILLLLQPLDCRSKPSAKRLFDFLLIAGFVQRAECLSLGVERDVAAGNLLQDPAWRNKLHQNAGSARLAVGRRVEVHASRRVFKGKRLSARLMRRTSVPAFFEKAKLEFQKLQKGAIVFWCGHGLLQ